MTTNEDHKKKIVEAILMLERVGIFDFNGHFSMRVPGKEQIWINSGKSVRSGLTTDDIVTIDFSGALVEGVDQPPMEYHIHTEIYKRRKDVQSIAHPHPKWSTLFSTARVPLLPVINQAAVLGDIQYFPHSFSINTSEMGEQLAESLGPHRAVLLKSHGAVIVGEGVLETFVSTYYLEDNAYRHYLAAQLGKVYPLSQDELKVMGKHLWKPNLLQKVWDYEHFKIWGNL